MQGIKPGEIYRALVADLVRGLDERARALEAWGRGEPRLRVAPQTDEDRATNHVRIRADVSDGHCPNE